MGLQVPQSSRGLLEATAHTGYIHVQQESLDPQVFDLGGELQGYSNQCPGLLLGSNNLAIPSCPSLSSGTVEGFLSKQIEAILICPEWKGVMWWPQLVELRIEWLQSF